MKPWRPGMEMTKPVPAPVLEVEADEEIMAPLHASIANAIAARGEPTPATAKHVASITKVAVQR